MQKVNITVDYCTFRRYDAGMPSARASDRTLGPIFDALANDERRRILVHLANGPASTPEVAAQFGFTKQALSRHVALLENAGLIDRSVRGRARRLRLVPGRLERVSAWVSELQRGWEASLDRLDATLGGRE